MPSGLDLRAKYFKRSPVPSERFLNKCQMKSVTWAPKIISGEVQPDAELIRLISPTNQLVPQRVAIKLPPITTFSSFGIQIAPSRRN